ncbi:hypothetical protein [Butyrivibrio sp. INlla18]|nr:hypothetical protein [Butyrivibrio sp. INlla18]
MAKFSWTRGSKLFCCRVYKLALTECALKAHDRQKPDEYRS